jgi:hypothetical protein
MVPEQVWDWHFCSYWCVFFVFHLFFVSPCLVLSVASWGSVSLAVSSSPWEWRFIYSYERYIYSIMNFIVKSTGFSCRMFLLDFILMAVQIHVPSHMSCLHPPLVSVLLHFHMRKSFSLCSFCLPQFITGLCCSGNTHWGDSLIILCCSMCHLYRFLLFSSITLRREERQRGWIIRQWIGTGAKTGSK